MKALLIAEQLRQPIPGGIGTYIDGLCSGLMKISDIQPTLFTSKYRLNESSDVADPLLRYGLPISYSRFSSRVMTTLWSARWGKTKLGVHPDNWEVVHATSLLTPPKLSVPMTAMVHDLAWRAHPEAYPARGRKWHERALTHAIARADFFFVPSSATANDLISAGVPAKQIGVVPLGWDHLPEPDDERADALLKRFGVTGGFLLVVGTQEPRKNLARLLAAYTEICEQIHDLPLLLVGPEGWGGKLQPTPGVFLAGMPSAAVLTSLYRKCSVFVSVPLMEGFGLPVLEAMSQGAPVVSSETPSAGDATYRVDPHNVAAIGEGIKRVLNDRALRLELIAKGKLHAGPFTWERCARAHASVWRELGVA